VLYYFPEKWCENAENAAKHWKRPNGYGQVFADSEADRLRRERDRLTQRLAQKDDEIKGQRVLREAAERRTAAARGQITKIKNRVGHGV
jgi:hypothetical protein